MTDESMEPLVTECPNCRTRFRVTESQLEMAAGKVRCGACLEVFLGIENLVLGDDAGVLDEDANEALDALLSELGSGGKNETGVVADRPRPASPDGHPPLSSSGVETGQRPAFEELEDLDELEFLPADEVRSEAGEQAAEALPTFEVEELEDDLEEFEVLEPTAQSSERTGEAAGQETGEAAGQETGEATGEEGEEDDLVSAAVVDLDVPLEFKLDDDEEDVATPPETVEEKTPDPKRALDAVAAAADVEEIVLDDGEAPNAFGWRGFQSSGEPAKRPAQNVPKANLPKAEDADPLASIGPLDVVIEPETLDAEPDRRRRTWVPFAVAVASLALVAQVFWFQRDAWSKDLALRPIYEFACAHLGCRLEPLRAVDAIYSKNLVVRTHPDVEQALLVDALVVNGAGFPQPYPVIELRFSSIEGRTVAGRRFKPQEYLAGEAKGAELIAPNTPVHIALAIDDPGPDAVNYVMLFH